MDAGREASMTVGTNLDTVYFKRHGQVQETALSSAFIRILRVSLLSIK